MGRASRGKWLRRWNRMHAAGEVPADRKVTEGYIITAGRFTRAEWQAFNAKRELEGRTLTLDQRIAKRFAEAQGTIRQRTTSLPLEDPTP